VDAAADFSYLCRFQHCELLMHAWLAAGDGEVLLRADRIVEVVDGMEVSVRLLDNPAKLYPVTQAVPDSGHELAALLNQAEELAHHYGRPQLITASDGNPAHWTIAKMDLPPESLTVWPPAPRPEPAEPDAYGGAGPEGPLPSDGPLPYFTLGAT
jgi:hypothetical protein